MSALSELLSLPGSEKAARGLEHTPAEIAQQPEAWLSTFEVFRRKREQIAEFLALAGIGASPRPRPTVFLIGAGTSDYIGQSLTFLLRRCWNCEVMAVPSTDLLTHMDEWMIPEKKYLWISFSRSGDSPEGVAVLENARKNHPDIHHLVVSCNAKGRMIRESADDPRVLGICLDDAVNDRGLAMTSSFSNMVIFGQCLAHVNDVGTYEEVLSQLVEAGRDFLPRAADCASALAKEAYTKACFVGSGALQGGGEGICSEAFGVDGGKDFDDVGVGSGVAAWSDGGVGSSIRCSFVFFRAAGGCRPTSGICWMRLGRSGWWDAGWWWAGVKSAGTRWPNIIWRRVR